jgi:hypothetical protein
VRRSGLLRCSTLVSALLVGLLLACATLLVCATAWASTEKPTVGEVSPDSAGATSETLRAEIDPNGSDTTYYVEYGKTPAYGAIAPVGPADIGSGSSNVPVAVTLSGLETGASYHYRLMATNSQGVTSTEDATFSAFGVVDFNGKVANPDGSPDVEAGSHPYEVTTNFKFTQTSVKGKVVPAGALKDMRLVLPTGLGGDPSAVPPCPQSLLAAEGDSLGISLCPADSQIGLVRLKVNGLGEIVVPLYNMVPTARAPAEFGVYALLFPLAMGATIDPRDGYALSVALSNVTELFPLEGIAVTLWGVPADSSHDTLRGACVTPFGGESNGSCPSGGQLKPFLTLPGSCGSPLAFGLQVDSWTQPGMFVDATATSEDAAGNKPNVTGCDRLDFSPSLSVQTDTSAADSPTGLSIDVGVPHEESPTGLAQASLEDVLVKLPEGMSINVAAADGLGACTEAQVGLGEGQPASCPPNSAIGTTEIDTPLLPVALVGSIFLAEPEERPLQGKLAAYIVAEADGVVVKLAAQLVADPATGQLTVTVEGVPQVAFTHMKLNFRGGPRAAIANPESCGSLPVSSQLTLYARSATAGLQPTLSRDIEVESNCGGGFAPSFTAGTSNTGAGDATGFTFEVGREDGQQEIRSLSASLPDGLLAKLGSVPLCEAQHLTLDTCAGSLIGKATIAAGAGSHPFYLPAAVYLTGPYEGAPFGLAIFSSAIAGPFDLGTVEIRARLQLDRHDAHLTIATDRIPRILGGIPLRIRTIAVSIERHGFMLNPTSCAAGRRVDAEVAGAQATAKVSSPFNLTGCSHLSFSPSVRASTRASVSRRDGASLDLKISEPAGGQANLGALKVVFPSQLSPRLGAIQHSCLRDVFEKNPAACPAGARIGSAQVKTGLLAVPLRGPAYFVSDGKAAAPKLAMLLQGQGVVLELEGSMTVAKGGSSAITFKGIPDAAISSLDVSLPSGKNSALGSNKLSKATGRLCGKKLILRTAAIGQNGRRLKRSIRVGISGCPKHKRKRR